MHVANQAGKADKLYLLARLHGFYKFEAGVMGVEGVSEAPQQLPVITAWASKCRLSTTVWLRVADSIVVATNMRLSSC